MSVLVDAIDSINQSGQNQTQKSIPSISSTPRNCQRIVIYSGSFDPLHNAHKTTIAELYNKFDDIYIVPDRYKNNMMFSDNARLKFISDYISKCFPISNKIHILNDVLEDKTGSLSKTFNLVNHI